MNALEQMQEKFDDRQQFYIQYKLWFIIIMLVNNYKVSLKSFRDFLRI